MRPLTTGSRFLSVSFPRRLAPASVFEVDRQLLQLVRVDATAGTSASKVARTLPLCGEPRPILAIFSRASAPLCRMLREGRGFAIVLRALRLENKRCRHWKN